MKSYRAYTSCEFERAIAGQNVLGAVDGGSREQPAMTRRIRTDDPILGGLVSGHRRSVEGVHHFRPVSPRVPPFSGV